MIDFGNEYDGYLGDVVVKIVNDTIYTLPQYATPGSSGVDLRANISEPRKIQPHGYAMIPTGIYIELPIGYEAQIRSRSGLAFNHGITVLNSPGTIDSDYRGEIKIILMNHSGSEFIVEPGQKIAQMIVAKFEKIRWYGVSNLSDTERSDGGFGSTDK
jgi:dUTP pyrophosphatase